MSDRGVLTVAILIPLILALVFRLTDVWGEPDAAWLGVVALDWRLGSEDAGSYSQRMSPLYIWLVYWVSFVVPTRKIPEVMNLVNALSTIPFVWGSHRTWRTFFPLRSVVVIHWLLLFFPAVWMMHFFGFPTGIACALWMCGTALLFTSGSRLISAALFALAVSFKTDVVLLTPALLWWALRMQKSEQRERLKAVLYVLGGTLAGIAFNGILSFLLFRGSSLVHALDSWGHAFSYTAVYFFSRYNVRAVVATCGPFFGLAAIAGALSCLQRGRRDFLFFALFWFGVPALFWQGRAGNSPRHLAGACLVLAPLIVFFLQDLASRLVSAFRTKRAMETEVALGTLLVLALTLVNYFSIPNPGPLYSSRRSVLLDQIYAPTTRVFDIPASLQMEAATLHKELGNAPHVPPTWWEKAYYFWERRRSKFERWLARPDRKDG